jgi:hypothetical protein
MSDEIIDSSATAGTGARPVFLTVLCILTFIGSGWGAIGNFVTEGGQYVPMWYKMAILACNAATGAGAYMMWNLKKSGLMIYTAGEGLAIILPFIFLYGVLGGSGPVADLLASMILLMTIFPIAFIVMYWINAKHLK